MRMNQDERRFDFHGLGAALKRAREEKGWTQAYVAELVDRDSRTIMNIENKGQYWSEPQSLDKNVLSILRMSSELYRAHSF